MTLTFRPATQNDFASLELMVIDAFEPITWQKKLDAWMGPLNGCDWRQRWSLRMQKIFATQLVLVGELNGDLAVRELTAGELAASELAAMASATIDQEATLGFIDVLAVGKKFQGCGLGREMLRGMIEHLKSMGCQFVNLDCLTHNDAGNALYRSEGFEETARHIRWFKKI